VRCIRKKACPLFVSFRHCVEDLMLEVRELQRRKLFVRITREEP
jgi:hypothetical protein